MSKKIVLGVVIVLILCLLGIGIYKKTNKNQEKDVIKIGAILPLTGNLSFIGLFEKNSLEMGINGNHKVQIIYEDCKGSPKDAALAASKLVNIDKVNMVISTLSFISESVNPILENNKIPHFIFSFSPKLPSEKQNIYRYFVSSTGEANTFVNYILRNKFKRVAFLRHREPDAEYAFNTITSQILKNNKIEILDFPFSDQDFDFKAYAQKIKISKPDLIVVQAFGFKIPNIIRALKENKVKSLIVGDLNFLDIDLSNNENKVLVNGIPFVGLAFQKDTNYIMYTKEYQKLYNMPAFTLGAFAYDLGKLINYSAENNVKLINENMPRLINSTKNLIVRNKGILKNEIDVEYSLFLFNADSLIRQE